MFSIIRYALWVLLKGMNIALLLRALFSWIPVSDRLYAIFEAITEPCILPARTLLAAFGYDDFSPIDIPFLITFILFSILEAVFAV